MQAVCVRVIRRRHSPMSASRANRLLAPPPPESSEDGGFVGGEGGGGAGSLTVTVRLSELSLESASVTELLTDTDIALPAAESAEILNAVLLFAALLRVPRSQVALLPLIVHPLSAETKLMLAGKSIVNMLALAVSGPPFCTSAV